MYVCNSLRIRIDSEMFSKLVRPRSVPVKSKPIKCVYTYVCV